MELNINQDLTLMSKWEDSHFDMSQTNGKPLPQLAEDLTGNVQQYEAFMDALKAVSVMPVAFETLTPSTDGECRYDSRTIAVREGMSEVQTISALIHEMTHAELHDYNEKVEEQERETAGMEDVADQDGTEARPQLRSRRAEEVEAESVSYVVCQHYSIETGANSFGYIAHWSKNRELNELKASLEIIRKTAASMIDRIDGQFAEICKERSIDLTPVQDALEQTAEAPVLEEQPATATPQVQDESNRFVVVPDSDAFFIRDTVSDVFYGENGLVIRFIEEAAANEAAAKLNREGLQAEQPEKSSPKHSYYITNRQREQAERMAAKWEARAEAFYAGGDGWGLDTAGYCKTPEEAQQVGEQAEKIHASINNLVSGTGTLADVQVIQSAVSGRDELDAQIAVNQDMRTDMPEKKPQEPATPDKSEKQYDLGYGHMGNGLTVWNRLEEKNGDYVTVAHIDPDRSVTFYEKDMPDSVKARIEDVAHTSDMTVSATQDTPVFRTPAQTPEQIQAAPEQDPDEILPDPAISLSERDLYGYTDPTMLPLLKNRALELYDADHTVYMLYPDGTENMVFDRTDIETHDGILGIETEEWEASQEFSSIAVAAKNSEASKESDLIYGSENTYGIYQLKGGEEMRDYRFESLASLVTQGLSVGRANYKLVYTAPMTGADTLDSIYEQFNINHPVDFKGHSLSVSDIVVLQQNGNVTSHYVDSFGIKELPSFLGDEKQAQTVQPEHTPPQPEVDPNELNPGMEMDFIRTELEQAEFGMSKEEYIRSNFGESDSPTVAELEAEVNAGKQISLTDLARAVKNEPKQPPARKGKPSILGQLRELQQTAQNKDSHNPAPKRGNDLEV